MRVLLASTPLTPLTPSVPAPDVRSLILVLAASCGAAILSRLARRFVLPGVVVEIVLGILIGPEVLRVAQVDPYIS